MEAKPLPIDGMNRTHALQRNATRTIKNMIAVWPEGWKARQGTNSVQDGGWSGIKAPPFFLSRSTIMTRTIFGIGTADGLIGSAKKVFTTAADAPSDPFTATWNFSYDFRPALIPNWSAGQGQTIVVPVGTAGNTIERFSYPTPTRKAPYTITLVSNPMYATYYKGRLFLASKTQIQFQQILAPYTEGKKLNDPDADLGAVTGIGAFETSPELDEGMIIFQEEGVSMVRGDPIYGGTAQVVARGEGAFAGQAFCPTPFGVVFMGRTNLWIMNSSGSVMSIGSPILTEIRSITDTIGNGDFFSMDYVDEVLMINFYDASAATLTVLMGYFSPDRSKIRWSLWEFSSVFGVYKDVTSYLALVNTGTPAISRTRLNTTSGRDEWSTAADISAQIKWSRFDFGFPRRQKYVFGVSLGGQIKQATGAPKASFAAQDSIGSTAQSADAGSVQSAGAGRLDIQFNGVNQAGYELDLTVTIPRPDQNLMIAEAVGFVDVIASELP